MDVINDFVQCTIRIRHEPADAAAIDNITAVDIRRREKGEKYWQTIGTVYIDQTDDLKFEAVDIAAASGVDYEYQAVYLAGYAETAGDVYEVQSAFDGVFIGNAERQYVTRFNVKCQYQRNGNMTYVKPFNSRCPHSICNGNSNYDTGTVEGVFNPLDDTCSLQLVNGGRLRRELFDFLSDGVPKILKTNQ